jgi:hypothetical protein
MIRTFAAAAILAVTTLARAADPAAEAAQSYRIDTAGSTTEVKAGGSGTLVLAIVPVGKVHVHPQAPLKIALESQGLRLEKTALGHKDAVDPAAEGPRFVVPFVAPQAGKQQAMAKLDFFICSDQWCVKQVRDVTLAVAVK